MKKTILAVALAAMTISAANAAPSRGGVTGFGAKGLIVSGVNYINENGINAHESQINGVADGAVTPTSLQAVNGRQLWAIKKLEPEHIGSLAASLAALQPLAYNPDHPLTVSAGLGSYKSSQSLAVGAQYYLQENLRINGGVALSDRGQNMVNLGISYRFGGPQGGASLEDIQARRDAAQWRREADQLRDQLAQQAEELKAIKRMLADLTRK